MRLSAMYIRASEAQDRGDILHAADQFAAIAQEGQEILKEGRAKSASAAVERVVAHFASHHIQLLSKDFNDVDNVLKALELIIDYCKDRVRLLTPAYDLVRNIAAFNAAVAERRGNRFARANFQAISDKGSAVLRSLEGDPGCANEARLLRRLVDALG